ncbi:alpha/beta-Hydrolases superfamily protein [Melia azedarach]|uniref:Alpha/beta-Hydrolases superfamily protein n=1 Tax=Melia azedarach TaxID=155640 RepID=A0ACC1XCM4_MELAZ|nr:alpha/beta-Hydrolases superfamily protein [Melia azedarach]
MKLAAAFLPHPNTAPLSIPPSITHVRLFKHISHAPNAPCVRTYPPKKCDYKFNIQIINKACTGTKQQEMENKDNIVINAEKIRFEFLNILRSKRSAEVALTVERAKPVVNPLYQDDTPPNFSEAMESCPKANVENFKELLQEENLYLYTEAGEQGRLPVLILSMKESEQQKRPAIIFLHSTHKCKEWLRPLLEAYASRGYIAVAVDSRYHGERASSKTTYRDALVSSWKNGDTMPFIFDTAWDLVKLADYLTQREDIDPTRIGITGESLGGMHAWFAAAADTRYSVVVPIIGVQGFRWAIDNDKWQARVGSIKPVFEEARIDLGKSTLDKEVVEKVWDRIAPGLASQFDSPYTIPAIAPRPLLIVNGAEDPRCPLAGLEIPKARACQAYEEANCLDNFKLIAEPGIGHQMTPSMVKEAGAWFDKFLEH